MKPLLLLPVLALLAACAPVQEGDAVSYGRGDFRSSFLPRFSLGKPGAYEFQVSGLRERSFPHKLRIHSRLDAPGPPGDSFRDARVRVEVLDWDTRRRLAAKTFRLNTPRIVNQFAFDQFFWSRREPPLDFRSRYRVRVTVVTPSDRRFDEAQVMLR